MTKYASLAGAFALALSSLLYAASPAAAAQTVTLDDLFPTPVQVATTVIAPQACAASNHEARIVNAFRPEWPQIALDQGIDGGTATVEVRLSASGALLDSSMIESAGNPWLDQAAGRAVRLSRYTPEIRCGKSVAGTYLVKVFFANT